MKVKPNQIRLTLVHQYAEDRLPDKYPQDLQKEGSPTLALLSELQSFTCV